MEKSLEENLWKVLKEFSSEMNGLIVPLTGDASTRAYFRFEGNEFDYIICKELNPKAEANEDFCLTHEILNQKGIRVPKILNINHEHKTIIEEDLGDDTLLRHLVGANEDVIKSEYQKVIDTIIKLFDVRSESSKHQKIFDRAFDFEKLSSEMEMTVEFFLEKYLNTSTELSRNPEFMKEIHQICEELESSPRVFCHRDLHSRNVMVKDGEQYLIDFQDARMGPIFYDLVSLLEDCYFSLGPKLRESLYLYFMSKIEGAFEIKDYKRLYNLSAIQRIFKALGSFAYFYVDKGDDRYLKYIGIGVDRLLEILKEVGDFPAFEHTLQKSFYEH